MLGDAVPGAAGSGTAGPGVARLGEARKTDGSGQPELFCYSGGGQSPLYTHVAQVVGFHARFWHIHPSALNG